MTKPIRLSLFMLAGATLFLSAIDLQNLPDYESQAVPSYITRDNTGQNNPITDEGALLGRVLFYDKNLSTSGNQACASCHHQEFAFSDTLQLSDGHVGGKTGRHSMRLVNSRFSQERRFFWDERAATLEAQTIRPIQDHIEMGFSGANGDPDLDSLIRRLNQISYYPILFKNAFGDTIITENRMQRALAQFVRSIQSFDSKFDIGRAQVNNDADNFPNYTAAENAGKTIFLAPPPQGGAGCQGCHRAPEFDIDPAANNNGIIHVAGSVDSVDLTNTRSPSLRNLFNPQGILNGPLMHNGELTTIEQVIDHYSNIPDDVRNTNLDNRLLGPGGIGTQQLNLTQAQKNNLIAFLKTLSGNDVYTNSKWSNPFEPDGSLVLSGLTAVNPVAKKSQLLVYPNPSRDDIHIQTSGEISQLSLYAINGQLLYSKSNLNGSETQLQLPTEKGVYLLIIQLEDGTLFKEKVLKVN